MLYHVPESEEYEGGFEAVTMMGVPHNVSVTGRNPDFAESALSHVLDGLRAFGFTGYVAVEDATQTGKLERYEVSVSQK